MFSGQPVRTGACFLLAVLLLRCSTFAQSTITSPGDPTIGVVAAEGRPSYIAVNGLLPDANNYPTLESPILAIDGNPNTDYANLARFNAGIIVTPSIGLTNVQGVRFSAPAIYPSGDPLRFTLEGTNVANPGAALGSDWSLIARGETGLFTDPGRMTAGPTITFSNDQSYLSYRVLFPTIRSVSAVRMNVGEIELLGAPAPTPSVLPLTAGNILLSNRAMGTQDFMEFTPQGELVQRISISPLGDGRDLTIDRDGRVQLYNGTFTPTLTTYDRAANSYSSRTLVGWTTVNNSTYGGIGTFGKYVFVTDMTTNGDGGTRGVIRFDLDGGPTIRFANTLELIDLNIGLDGKLYTLSGGAVNAGGRRVTAFDPETMSEIRTIDLPEEHRGIAVDVDGSIYTAQTSGGSRVSHFSPQGVLLDSIDDPGVGGLGDIDINRNGDLLITSHGGRFLVTTTALDSIFASPPTQSSIFNFGTWIQTPPPQRSCDFDRDADVDGMDFLVWQRNVGRNRVPVLTPGDANEDGTINGADLEVWGLQFGTEILASLVPEPTAFEIATLTILGPIIGRRKSLGP